MNPADFVIWLRGYLDALGGHLTPDQLQRIAEALRDVNVPERTR